MLRLGNVKINGKRVKDNVDVKCGDTVSIYGLTKSMPKVDIIYIDDNILVVNKPQGIECATRDKSSDNTYSLEEILAEYSPIVVHRLDRLTEGLVILARNIDIARKFEKYFEERKIEKQSLELTILRPKNIFSSKVEVKFLLDVAFLHVVVKLEIMRICRNIEVFSQQLEGLVV